MLWHLKIRALLFHQGLEEALKREKGLPNIVKDKKKPLQKAHSAIILNLGDKVLRKVSKEKTTEGIMKKFEGYCT